jgi:hypothetical protein
VTKLKSVLAKSALIVTVACGILAASATVASADVACNRWGECWTVRDHYTTYPATLGVTFHDDAWREAHRTGHYIGVMTGRTTTVTTSTTSGIRSDRPARPPAGLATLRS